MAQRLIAGGLPPSTPVAAVQWGTDGRQRTARTTLGGLGSKEVEAPATIVIGQVAALGLGWYERRPLLGRSVVLTRAAHQAAPLGKQLAELGASVVEAPAIAVGAPDDGGAALAAGAARLATGYYAWAAFTSANAVHRTFDHLPDARRLGRTRLAAVGPATAAALASYRAPADLVPARHDAAALAEAFPGPAAAGDDSRVFLPLAAGAGPDLPRGLRARGWTVEAVEAYRTVPVALGADVLTRVAQADAVVFASSSAVSSLVGQAGREGVPGVVVCIGPGTAATARALGLTVTAEAGERSNDGLAAALVGALGRGGERTGTGAAPLA